MFPFDDVIMDVWQIGEVWILPEVLIHKIIILFTDTFPHISFYSCLRFLTTTHIIHLISLLVFNSAISCVQFALQWHHNEHNCVSNHWRPCCLLNCLFRRRSKKTSKLHVTGLCEGNPPVTAEFPSQRASKVENVFHLITSSCGFSYLSRVIHDFRINDSFIFVVHLNIRIKIYTVLVTIPSTYINQPVILEMMTEISSITQQEYI